MPYQVDVSAHPSKNIALAGWFASLPFTFDADGSVLARWDALLLICHLATDCEVREFRTNSSGALAKAGSVVIKMQGGSSKLTASEVRLDRICAQQAVGASETLWVFRGIGEGTVLKWSPPSLAFADWGQEDDDRCGWKGEIEGVGKLSFARVDWTGSQYFQAIHVAGPSGEAGARQLANKVLSCTRSFAGEPMVPQPGSACPELKLKDGSRDKRDLKFLGVDELGKAQVQGASGSVWFSQGSFASLTPQLLIQLAKDSHQKGRDLSDLLGDMPLAKTMELVVYGGHPRQWPDLMFEGLSLWDLKRRGENVNDAPVLL